MKALGDVPGEALIKQWLKAGYLEDGKYHDTPTGTPQGGVISPLLLNIALHGMRRPSACNTTARAQTEESVRWCDTQTTVRHEGGKDRAQGLIRNAMPRER